MESKNTFPSSSTGRNQYWEKSVIAILYLCLLSSSLKVCGANQSEGCTFPQRFEGSWFQSGVQQPISIKGNTFSCRGTCMASDGDKFLVADDSGCHRCLSILERHKNILQYTEGNCEAVNGNVNSTSSKALRKACKQIAGDAPIYSLFRKNTETVKCPLRGSFVFTYNQGHGECQNPVSHVDNVSDDRKLLFNFQACSDVAGTESKVEELTCLATWRNGNLRYLVGLLSHNHTASDEDRYRCFAYARLFSKEHTDVEYKLVQSADATCMGLDSETGSRVMTLRPLPPI